jgi:hypothetical protein
MASLNIAFAPPQAAVPHPHRVNWGLHGRAVALCGRITHRHLADLFHDLPLMDKKAAALNAREGLQQRATIGRSERGEAVEEFDRVGTRTQAQPGKAGIGFLGEARLDQRNDFIELLGRNHRALPVAWHCTDAPGSETSAWRILNCLATNATARRFAPAGFSCLR